MSLFGNDSKKGSKKDNNLKLKPIDIIQVYRMEVIRERRLQRVSEHHCRHAVIF